MPATSLEGSFGEDSMTGKTLASFGESKSGTGNSEEAETSVTGDAAGAKKQVAR